MARTVACGSERRRDDVGRWLDAARADDRWSGGRGRHRWRGHGAPLLVTPSAPHPVSARLRAVEARRPVSSDEGRHPRGAAAGSAKFATPVATNVIDRPRVFDRFDGRPDLGTVLV